MNKTRHLWIALGCLGVALLTAGYYQVTQYGKITFTLAGFGWTLLLAAGLFALLEGGHWLYKKFGKPEHAKRVTAIVFCVILVILSFLPLFCDLIQQEYPWYSAPTSLVNIGRDGSSYGILMTADMVLNQTFTCTQDSLSGITINSVTTGPEKDSTLTFVLTETESREVLQGWILDARTLGEVSNINLDVTEPAAQQNMEGKVLRLQIYSDDATGKNAVTLYATSSDAYPEGRLIVNGEDSGGDLCMALNGLTKPENYESVRIWMCVYTAALCVAAVVLAYRKFGGEAAESAGKKEKKHEKKRR